MESSMALSEPKSGFGAIIRENKIYIMGGSNQSPLSIFQEYTITSYGLSWKKLQPMNNKRDQLGCVLGLDGYLYVCGGINDQNQVLKTCQRYNFKIGKWQAINSMKNPRRSFTAVAVPDGIIVIGGHDGKNYLNSVEKYQYSNGKWVNLKNMQIPRCTHSTVISSDYQNIMVFGGFRNQPLKEVQIYSVLKNEWKAGVPLEEQRFLHCSILVTLL